MPLPTADDTPDVVQIEEVATPVISRREWLGLPPAVDLAASVALAIQMSNRMLAERKTV